VEVSRRGREEGVSIFGLERGCGSIGKGRVFEYWTMMIKIYIEVIKWGYSVQQEQKI